MEDAFAHLTPEKGIAAPQRVSGEPHELQVNPRNPYPPRIGWTTPGSFGALTVAHRFPKILTDVFEANVVSLHGRSSLTNMLEDMICHRPVPLGLLDPITPFWRDWIADLDNRSFADLSFLEIEFIFYHAINTILGVYSGAADPYDDRKKHAIQSALPKITLACTNILENETSLQSLIRYSLTGNMFDLSQLRLEAGPPKSIQLLVDQSHDIIDRIALNPSGAAAVVTDNIGVELFADLLLSYRLLAQQAFSRIDLYVKPWPIFVSDATRSDVNDHIEMLCRVPVEAARRLGTQLLDWVREGKITLREEVDWGEPKCFKEFEPCLAHELRSTGLVICKGDLNYRRWFDDREWPSATSLDYAGRLLDIGWPTAFLRVHQVGNNSWLP